MADFQRSDSTDNKENISPLDSPSALSSPEASTPGHAPKPAKRSVWGSVWDTFDLPPKERKLLFKVDAMILTFASLGYFIKNLDQNNVNNAFLSGMKEDLNMFGNELVTSTSIWTVGYVVGQIPSNLILTRVSPSVVIPLLELGWGVCTLATYSVKSVHALYALRFLVGLFESGFYPGIHYLLGGWYTPRELGKRAMIFWLAGSLGNMFSGFLQTAAFNTLNGVHGIAGWRWLFIIDAIITLPIALLGFIFLPGLPLQESKSRWLSSEELELARSRVHQLAFLCLTYAAIYGVLSVLKSRPSPALIYVFWNNAYIQQPMGYWLKSFNNAKNPPVPGRHYTVGQINTLPLPATAILVIVSLIWAWLSDGVFKGKRWPFIYIGAVISIALGVACRQAPLYSNIPARYAIYWLIYLGSGAGPLILSWINEICAGDSEKRALLVAMGNDFAYVVQAVAPNFVWKTTDFPAAKKGLLWSVILNIILIAWTALTQVLLAWDQKKARRQQQLEPAQAPVAESVADSYVSEFASDKKVVV